MRRLIRTDGTVEDFDKPIPFGEIAGRIGAAITDTVALHHLGHPLHVMVVDDLGYETKAIHHPDGLTEVVCTKPLKPVNTEATRLYHQNCIPGTTHQIVGDVLVVPDQDYA